MAMCARSLRLQPRKKRHERCRDNGTAQHPTEDSNSHLRESPGRCAAVINAEDEEKPRSEQEEHHYHSEKTAVRRAILNPLALECSKSSNAQSRPSARQCGR